MNITKRTKSEGTTVYQFRVFLSQSADGKQRTRSKTWQPPAGMTAKAAEKEAKRQAVIFENEVKQGRAALDARTKLSDVAREYIRNTEMEYKTKEWYEYFDIHFGGYDPEYTAMLYKMRAQSLSELDSVFTYYSIFPHFSNGFVVTVPMYTPAGSGMYWTDVQVDPNKRQASGQVLHGQDEWFTCDVTATGKVTVRALTDYVSSDGAVTYQDMKEWYELGDQTEFTVNGCYGNYVKMLMTSVGQDYAPYVFLLTEDGNVEYIDVISGAQCGTMANGGPLYGVNEIVKFEIGTAYDADFEAEYTTVYAVSRNNEKFNLVEAMHNADPMELSSLIGSYVSDYTGTWFEICEDQPNFYIGEYRNENREPATWDSGITYLGMDHRGWICSISLYRMDLGRAQRETVAMMPTDYGGFYVRHIGGESLLNLPKDESVWFEMTNE